MTRFSHILAWILVACAIPAWGEEPIKIGFLYLMSGRLATAGTTSKQGADLAIDEINAAGGINGRKVEGIFVDDKGDPAHALREVQRLVNTERVSAVMGVISSEVALAISPELDRLKIPFLVTSAQTPQITGERCNRYTFRITWSNNENLKTAVILAAQSKAKKWTTVGPDYVFGHEAWAAFKKHLAGARPDVSFVSDKEAAFSSIETADYSASAKKIKESGADGMLLTLFGGNLIDFLRQGRDHGLFDGSREAIVAVGPITVFLALGHETPEGIWAVTPYWYKANDSEINKKFVEDYERRFVFPPAFQAQFAYAAVKLYAEAVTRVGSTEGPHVVKALEGMTMDLPIGKLTIRPEDHQAVFEVIGGKTASGFIVTRSKKVIRKLDPLIRFPAEKISMPVDRTGCTMDRQP
jgi:branched-chain amino acid transport system substrate-binding protein